MKLNKYDINNYNYIFVIRWKQMMKQIQRMISKLTNRMKTFININHSKQRCTKNKKYKRSKNLNKMSLFQKKLRKKNRKLFKKINISKNHQSILMSITKNK